MDFEQARFNMVEQQVRTWAVLDQEVLDLLFQVRREDFVPPAYRTLAFADLEIPLGDGERMWTPKMEARVLQELQLKANESVLEIGTGSGYLTALLARRSADVTSVEINSRLHAEAWTHLAGVRPGGRLFAVVGDPPAMTARLTRWSAPGAIVHQDLFETVIAPLKNAPQPARFVF